MARVSRNSAIPEIVLTIPPIINRTEELPVGGKPPFDSIGTEEMEGIGVGVRINIAVGLGVGIGVADGVADSDTCEPCAKTVNDCIKVVNMPDELRVLIVIVWTPGERLDGGR